MNVTWQILHDTIAKCWHWDCCTIVITPSHIGECSITKRFQSRRHLHIWSTVDYTVARSRTRIFVNPVGLNFWSFSSRTQFSGRQLFIFELRCIDFLVFSLWVIMILRISRPYGVVSESFQGHFRSILFSTKQTLSWKMIDIIWEYFWVWNTENSKFQVFGLWTYLNQHACRCITLNIHQILMLFWNVLENIVWQMIIQNDPFAIKLSHILAVNNFCFDFEETKWLISLKNSQKELSEKNLTILFDGFNAATACQKFPSISASEIVSTNDFEYP